MLLCCLVDGGLALKWNKERCQSIPQWPKEKECQQNMWVRDAAALGKAPILGDWVIKVGESELIFHVFLNNSSTVQG